MKRLVRVATFLALFTSFVTGCVTTSVTGQRLSEVANPIEKLGILIVEGKFGTTPNVGNITYLNLMARLPKRMPLVFSANHIENKVALVGSNQKIEMKNEFADEKSFPYVLIIVPSKASFYARTDNVVIEMITTMVDRKTGKSIWKGGITFHKTGLTSVDDKSVDEFAKQLLVQLNKNGMIKLKAVEPVMPVL